MHPQDFTFFNAWIAWWTTGPISGSCLYGIPVLWLGRIGKLLQYFGALTVLLDIIGPARVSQFGASLRQLDLGTVTRRDALDASKFVAHIFMAQFHPGQEATRHQELAKQSKYAIVDATVACVLGTACSALFSGSIFEGLVLFLVFSLFFYALVSPIITALIAGAIGMTGFALDFLLITPLSKLLASPAADRYAKGLGLGVATIGFFMDLLAS